METPGWDPIKVPEPKGKRLRHFLKAFSSGCSLNLSGVSLFPVRPARSIPPTLRTRSSHTFLKRPPQSAVVENGPAPAPRVLHCLPPSVPQGRSLHFESFDADYLSQLRAGDFRTEQHFVSYFSSLIQIKLRSRLPSREAIEDVRQETFTRFFAALRAGRIQQPDRLGAYVNSMCNNVLMEQYRGNRRETPLDGAASDDIPAQGKDLADALASKQSDEKVREILEQLSERDRRVLREVFLEERDKDDVCRDFGIDREYLRVLLHRAKKAFKAIYLKNFGDDPPAFAEA